jgi:hypothetical protein
MDSVISIIPDLWRMHSSVVDRLINFVTGLALVSLFAGRRL